MCSHDSPMHIISDIIKERVCVSSRRANGNGVYGVSKNASGVCGTSTNKYGGDFFGGLAPLRLEPSNTAGSPTTGAHGAGELYVDINGVLYFCTADGTPGTWKTVMLAT
jgi:hypothetical protein